MQNDKLYLQHCINLALKGAGNVAPNPMVGCVIVHHNSIIGEGFHAKYGEAHAEVNAIQSVKDLSLLPESTVYVSLEPCNHYGKTPPCSDLLIKNKIKRVVIGCVDSFHKVDGKGIEKLKEAGIDVEFNVLEQESRLLNKRFFTVHERNRPYIILKWAETKNGFISRNLEDITSKEQNWISGAESKIYTHQMRANEQAILVGTQTVKIDNPELTTREVAGKNPLRMVIDKNLVLKKESKIFNQQANTLIFNLLKNDAKENIEWIKFEEKAFFKTLFETLVQKGISSLIVEGGKKTLEEFIAAGLWDEAFVIRGNTEFESGINAPLIDGKLIEQKMLGSDQLNLLVNPNNSYY